MKEYIQKMKIAFLTLILFVGVLTTSYAASPSEITAKDIKQKISETIYADMSSVPTEGVVFVVFSVNQEGKIIIKKMESTNSEATDFVTKKISSISCQNDIYPYHQLYSVKFKFEKN